MIGTRVCRSAWLVALAVSAIVFAACGGDRDAQDNFLREMIPHHEAAVRMADVALQRGEHPEMRELAQSITRDQEREIEQMRRILSARAPKATDTGMSHGSGPGDVEKLQSAPPPFDKAFIDAMIPHHESAITSAKEVEGKAKDRAVKDLAAAIISAQEREIAQMRQWRAQWYGQ